MCPRCEAGPHSYDLSVQLGRATLVFAGADRTPTTLLASTDVLCPTAGERYAVTVEVEALAGERVESVSLVDTETTGGATSEPATSATGTSPSDAPIPAGQVGELRRASLNQARDAAGKMLGAGTTAIAAYFTILKFVAGDHLSGGELVVAILPAVGYAAVTVLAAAAVRPVLLRVGDDDDLAAKQDELLVRLDRLLRAGVGVFAASTVLSAIAYLVAWP